MKQLSVRLQSPEHLPGKTPFFSILAFQVLNRQKYKCAFILLIELRMNGVSLPRKCKLHEIKNKWGKFYTVKCYHANIYM